MSVIPAGVVEESELALTVQCWDSNLRLPNYDQLADQCNYPQLRSCHIYMQTYARLFGKPLHREVQRKSHGRTWTMTFGFQSPVSQGCFCGLPPEEFKEIQVEQRACGPQCSREGNLKAKNMPLQRMTSSRSLAESARVASKADLTWYFQCQLFLPGISAQENRQIFTQSTVRSVQKCTKLQDLKLTSICVTRVALICRHPIIYISDIRADILATDTYLYPFECSQVSDDYQSEDGLKPLLFNQTHSSFEF